MSSITMKDACHVARGFHGEMREMNKGQTYYRAVIMKAAIQNAVRFWQWDTSDLRWKDDIRKDVFLYMSTRYDEVPFMNYQQRQANLMYDFRLVTRYLTSDPRKREFIAGKNIRIGDELIWVDPDLVYQCGDEIELIWIKTGKSTYTNGHSQKSNERELQLWAGIKYGRQLGGKNIKASYYYLRKTTDYEDWARNDPSFFGNGGNVVRITDLYEGKPNELDIQMKALEDAYQFGYEPEEIDDAECENCPIYDLCKFQLPPTRLEQN